MRLVLFCCIESVEDYFGSMFGIVMFDSTPENNKP